MTNPYTPADDGFHFDSMSDRWWETETAWFSWFHPERRLGGWLYVLVRPNIGTVSGGAWVWDHSGHLPWDVLYSENYTSLRLRKGQDLVSTTLPTGVSVRVLHPLTSYEIGYSDPGRLDVRLQFDAIMPPRPLDTSDSAFGHQGHFDQYGRVHGSLDLYGEEVKIDCLAMRDRSWGPRPEHRPRRAAYVTGIADEGCGFLAVSAPSGEHEPVAHGFVLRDGRTVAIKNGHRAVRRHPEGGWVTEVRVEGVDAEGHQFSAKGTPVSRIFINRHSFIDCNSLIRWEFEGREAWGEDQDLWPVHDWAEARRGLRPTNP